ncbi:MAG: universal stress protein [Dehalococcoidales bacterium]|jgi:nucleotide-binding universal stress UspA family protein|nr:universal stress protein [Dehalococcoidales bacterium]
MFKRILVPLDGSRYGSKALDYARAIAEKFGAEIILLQVVKPSVPVTPTGIGEPMIQSPAATRTAIQIAQNEDKRNSTSAARYLGRKVRDLKAKNIEGSYQIIIGTPAEAIMNYSQKNKIDLIIMTTHGKSGIVRAVMGSVADEVVRNSGKPVMVIRPKKGK